MIQRLTREINVLERQAIQVRTKLSNYQKYASMLGGTTEISMANIAGLSSDLLPRASMFARFSNEASSMSAMQNLQAMKAGGLVPYYANNPLMQYQLEMSSYNKFRQESLKALKQEEANVLNEKEKDIQLTLNGIEQRLTMKRTELQSYQQLASQEAKENVPRFGLG